MTSLVGPLDVVTVGDYISVISTVKGYPLPDIKWRFIPCETNMIECKNSSSSTKFKVR